MPALTILWIWICAWLNCAGWLLSLAHALNAGGYAVALFIGIALWWLWAKQAGPTFWAGLRWATLRRRFRRAFPLAFLSLAVMVTISGAVYPPTNYDGLTYRLPRISHWLAAGQWHWIHTIFPRVNARACGSEWVAAPIMALTKSDREVYLMNIVSLLLLPGQVYSLFTRVGVRRRVAWHWMWLTPTGYCFLIQAGGIGNDLFGAPFVLAAMDFALRARGSRSAADFFTAILAAGLMTSAKTSDLPLMLPWSIAMLPSWRLMLRWPLRLAAICVIAAAASFLPTAALNIHYCHDWTGWKSEGVPAHADSALRLAMNVPLVAVQNFVPTVFPWAKQWNEFVQDHVPADLHQRMLDTVVEPGAADFLVDEIQIEENAGLGFGVCMLLLISCVAGLIRGSYRIRRPDSLEALWLTSLRWLPQVSFLALMCQSEVQPIARILAPYYAVMMPAFLSGPAQSALVRRGWWRALGAGVFGLALLALIILPARPLLPIRTILAHISAGRARSPVLNRIDAVYTVYGERHDAFAPALAQLPPGTRVLGFVTYDEPEAGLWLPYGSRRIVHVCPEDTADFLRSEGVQYILCRPGRVRERFQMDPEKWADSLGAVRVKTIPLKLKVREGPQDWWLLKLP